MTTTQNLKLYKESVKLKEEIKKTVHLKNWSLHFYSKCIYYEACQVMMLKNEDKLGALDLLNGKADTQKNHGCSR